MRAKGVLLLAAAMLAAAPAAESHHSFAATYDESETVTITGRMVQFSLRNPHSFVQVEVTDQNGGKVRWAVEWAGTAQLRNTGVENDTLRYGDTVEVTGNPGRNPEDHRIRMRTVKRPDGFSWGERPGEVVD
jgi:lysyl-tRNA synthetase class II